MSGTAQVDAARELVNELRRWEAQQPLRQHAAASGGGPPPPPRLAVDATETLFDFYLQLAWVPCKKMLEDWKNNAKNGKKLLPMADVMEAARRREQRGKGARGGGGERFGMRSGRELYRGMLDGELSACAVLTHRNAAEGVEPIYVSGFGAIGAAAVRGGGGSGAAAREPATIDTAGGINLPKIVECIGSDGSVSKQLVKGKDDLRQDAVMQQVFTLVNVLLRRDVAARKRALHMRAYRVVPLAPTAGVLQWVDNTMPVSSWLVKGHDRHRPSTSGDWTNQECRNTMSAARKVADTMAPAAAATHLLKEYQKVSKHFHPVMHLLFLERWPHPAAWFERRLAYARSLAAGSMVGFVLGLGDRHASNILIDNNSAELVHIDLGIAFGAGRLLPTPERVPFRLTRDLEAGLGVCGVEGVMRGAAEQCMRVLRDSTEPLLTVLEVFVRSPLHKWSFSPLAKGAAKQTAAKQTAATAAAAAAAPPPPPPLVHPRGRRSSAAGGATGLGGAAGFGGAAGLGCAPGGEGSASASSAGSAGAAAAGQERAEIESSELETTNREAEHVLLETQERRQPCVLEAAAPRI